jgi:hypothetical protein
MKSSILSLLLLTPLPTLAGTAITVPTIGSPDDGWEIRAAAYLWATQLDGDIIIKGNTVPVDVSFDDLLQQIDFAFTGVIEARKGRWGILADLFYAKVSTEANGRILDIESELEQFMGNFSVSYRWIETPDRFFDTFAGVRVNSMETTIEVDRPFAPDFTASDTQTWADLVIGIRFQQELTEKLFFRAVGDIGGFGLESDLTWQAMVSLGYHVSDHSAVVLGYRAIGSDYTDKNFTYDVTSHGLLLGYEMKF